MFLILEKSPGTKTSSKMKPIEEGMEDNVFEESPPPQSGHVTSAAAEEA